MSSQCKLSTIHKIASLFHKNIILFLKAFHAVVSAHSVCSSSWISMASTRSCGKIKRTLILSISLSEPKTPQNDMYILIHRCVSFSTVGCDILFWVCLVYALLNFHWQVDWYVQVHWNINVHVTWTACTVFTDYWHHSCNECLLHPGLCVTQCKGLERTVHWRRPLVSRNSIEWPRRLILAQYMYEKKDTLPRSRRLVVLHGLPLPV